MKPITFSQHARVQMAERGASDEEVIQAIRTGEEAPGKRGRLAYRKNFQFDRVWGGRRYASNRSWQSLPSRRTSY
jgi:hypothetical protein